MAISDWIDTVGSWAGQTQEVASEMGLGSIDWNPFHSPLWGSPAPSPTAPVAVQAPAPRSNLTPVLMVGGVLLAVYLLSRRSRR